MARGFTAADYRKLTGKTAPVVKPRPRADRYAASVDALCDRHGLPRPVAEFTFHPTRKWRGDFVWKNEKVALEVDGAIWTHGRHTRGSGYVKDMEKRRAYAELGYLLVPCSPTELHAGVWVEAVRGALRWTRIFPK